MTKRGAPARFILMTIALLAVPAGGAVAQVGKLMPSDEAVKDPQFFLFRAQLQAAIAQHDAAAVLEAVDPDIQVDFGGGHGRADFQASWSLSEDSELWDELGTVLALGGSFEEKDDFSAPYAYSRWPEGFDAFEHVVVIGTDVRVRSKPGLGGRILTKLSYDIVKTANAAQEELGEDRDWTAIQLRDGRTGYVASQYVRSPVDYRAGFSRKNGRWWLSSFVAGD